MPTPGGRHVAHVTLREIARARVHSHYAVGMAIQ